MNSAAAAPDDLEHEGSLLPLPAPSPATSPSRVATAAPLLFLLSTLAFALIFVACNIARKLFAASTLAFFFALLSLALYHETKARCAALAESRALGQEGAGQQLPGLVDSDATTTTAKVKSARRGAMGAMGAMEHWANEKRVAFMAVLVGASVAFICYASVLGSATSDHRAATATMLVAILGVCATLVRGCKSGGGRCGVRCGVCCYMWLWGGVVVSSWG